MSIEAMSKAYEALNKSRPFDADNARMQRDAMDALRAAIQQTETEPVGMLVSDEFDGHCFIPNGDRWPFNEPLYTHPAPGVPDGWVDAAERVPLESDGEVFVRFSDGSIGTAWASYWHGASNAFAQWTHPDPDEDRTIAYWMKAPAHTAAQAQKGQP